MTILFVAQSRRLQQWGSDVGLTKHLFLVGIDDGPLGQVAARRNAERTAGQTDWTVIAHDEVDAADEETVLARIAAKESQVDPRYYPQIRGAVGIIKLKPANVENWLLIQKALSNLETKSVKVTPGAIGKYLLRLAKGG